MASKRRIMFDPRSFLARVAEGRMVVRYHKGQAIFSQGDPADSIFYIEEGQAKVAVVSEQGKEAVVAILGAGEFFGEACLAGQHQRMETVTALQDTAVLRLERSAIIRLIHNDPAFSEMFIAHLVERTIRVEADLIDHIFNSSEKRLARLLLLLAHFGKDDSAEPIIARISQETLAEMVGTTRSRVSFFMNKFRRLGFIEYNGSIRVHSSLLNVVLHEGDKTGR
ncbi:Crp/Fnr family transcriptional regulator [Pseudaminobacter salicylatoxidans]|uniref:Crp/Fnr family transcriptional regulator n=1 Tax=Pseudaminobacter salicylatoxidans TaxID=93369 RepID=A0A316CAA2_PSESE|nr:Crp/Fnr family transcriptional regulator [Pseudaminobacter salicylatoxidans]PWJ86428.1 Crp/Fnr family transcriptional regulator [Pseudaminobacter salicylatoxidans]